MKKVTASDVNVTWDAGPNVGTIGYEASANYIWSIKVNVVEIAIGAMGTFTPGKPYQANMPPNPPISIKSGQPGLSWDASVTFNSPGGAASIAHIKAGFLQNLTVKTFTATYGVAVVGAKYQGKPLLTTPYWDAFPFSDDKFYDTKDKPGAFFTGKDQSAGKPNVIKSFDVPYYEPYGNGKGGNLAALNLLWLFDLYVAATTNEQPQSYAGEAVANWSFDGSGSFAVGVWTPAKTAAVAAPKNNEWVALTSSSPQPVTNTPLFNKILSTHPIQP